MHRSIPSVRFAACSKSVFIAAMFTLGVCSMVLIAPPAAGQVEASEPKVKMRVVPTTKRVEVGETFHLAVIFDASPGWHIYWRNPGAGAAPPWIDIDGPDVCEVGDIRWPRPKVITSDVGDMYCYEDRTILYVPVKVNAVPRDGSMTLFFLDVGCAVCDDKQCFMPQVRLTAKVEVQAGGLGNRRPPTTRPTLPSSLPGDDAQERAKLKQDIETFIKQLPVQITDDAERNKKHDVKVVMDGPTLTITGKAHGKDEAVFFPGGVNGIEFIDPTIAIDADDDTFAFKATVNINRRNILDEDPKITGLIALGKERSDPSYEFTLPLPGD